MFLNRTNCTFLIMPPKHIKIGQTHGYVGDKPKYKATQREIVDITVQYRLERDRVIWKTTKDAETKEALKLKYGL